MVLHLAHHKSYHHARRDNIERVKKDEAEAKRQQELEELASLQADSEARLEMLRKHAGERATESYAALKAAPDGHTVKKRKRLDAGEAELEAQLAANGWQMSRQAIAEQEEKQESRATILRPDAAEPQETNGHINFWAGMEKGLQPSLAVAAGNEEYQAEKKKEQDKWEEQITMYLGRPAKELKPWYGERDLKNGEDRKKTQDQLLEAAYRDEELKRMSDPLAMMSAYLKKRQEVKEVQEKARLDPWAATPQHSSAMPAPNLLRPKTKYGEEPAYKRHIRANLDKEGLEDDYGPARPRPPPPSTEKVAEVKSLKDETKERESSERARAKALKEAARKKARLQSETPRSDFGYSDQFNKRETKEAKRSWRDRRWDQDMHPSKQYDFDRERDRRRRDSYSSSSRY